MAEQTKTVYFVEETQNIEGAYIEVNTLYVADSQEEATEIYEKLLKEKPKKSFGLLLNKYLIQADSNIFHKLLQSWKNLPADFYRKMSFLNYQPLAEFQG